MTIHSLPQIGSVLRNAVTFNFKNPPEVIRNAEILVTQTEEFFDLLESRKTDFVLVNGIALLTHVEGRNTQDIDLIMALPSLSKLPEIKIESQDMYFARGKYGELQIDILLTKSPLFAEVEKNHTTTKQFVDRTIRCATVDGLILLKLFALPSLYRQGSFERVGIYENDIATLIYQFKPNTEKLFAELNKHLNETDMTEARQIMADIEIRIQRFRKSNK
jgi:predicted nucleotidyltransferase